MPPKRHKPGNGNAVH